MSKTDEDIMALFHAVAFNRYILTMQKNAENEFKAKTEQYEEYIRKRDILTGKIKYDGRTADKADEEDSDDEYDDELDPVYTFLKRPVRVVRLGDLVPQNCNDTVLEKTVEDFEILMNFFSKTGFKVKDNVAALFDVEKDGTLTKRYKERLKLSSWVKFLQNTKKVTDTDRKTYFEQWTKAFSNILDHSEIDKPEKFLDAMNRIDNMCLFDDLDKCKLYSKFNEGMFNLPSDKRRANPGSFNKAQIADEFRKASRRVSSEDWEKAITSYEDKGSFKGQSIFLLDDTITPEKYIAYWEMTIKLFSKSTSESPVTGSLVHRLFSVIPIMSLTTPGSKLDNGVISLKKRGTFSSYGHEDDKHHEYDWFAIFEEKAYVQHYINLLKVVKGREKQDSIGTEESAEKTIASYQRSFCVSILRSHPSSHEWLRYMMSFKTKTEEFFKNTNYNFSDSIRLVLKGTQRNIGVDVTIAALMAKHNGKIDWDGNTPVVKIGRRTICYEGGQYKIEKKSFSTWNEADDAL